jgi:tetratricopeptide (TPR) repeat protein
VSDFSQLAKLPQDTQTRKVLTLVDFAVLTQVKQGLQKSDQERHQQSLDLYNQGRQLIREAMKQPVDKAKLKQATDCFSKGIQANYKNPSNYFGMGFLFLLIGQAAEAIPFIKSGLDLEPDSELGLALFEQAQDGLLPKATQKSVLPNIPQIDTSQADLDFDELYDRTEAAILLFLKQIMSDEVLGYVPSPNSKQLSLVQSKLKHFQAKNQAFQQQLQILDQEIEVSDLRQHLSTIDKAMQRILSLSQLFEEFIEIHQDIKKHHDLTDGIIAESQTTVDPHDTEVLEENLQVLLDHCDSVADRLDEIESKRIDIGPLQSPYQNYAEQLERFQDVLEETIERLKTV